MLFAERKKKRKKAVMQSDINKHRSRITRQKRNLRMDFVSLRFEVLLDFNTTLSSRCFIVNGV